MKKFFKGLVSFALIISITIGVVYSVMSFDSFEDFFMAVGKKFSEIQNIITGKNQIKYQTPEKFNLAVSAVKKEDDFDEYEVNLLSSWKDDRFYYYIFNMGEIKTVRLSTNTLDDERVARMWNGLPLGDEHITITTRESVENSVSDVTERARNVTETAYAEQSLNDRMSINVSVAEEASGVKGSIGISKEVTANTKYGYSVSAAKKNSKSWSDTTKDVIEDKVEYSTSIPWSMFNGTCPYGWYRYVLVGDLKLYASVAYDVLSDKYYVGEYSEIVGSGYTWQYAENLSGFSEYDKINGYNYFDFSIVKDKLSEPETYIDNHGDGSAENPYVIRTAEDLFNKIKAENNYGKGMFYNIYADEINVSGKTMGSIEDFNGHLNGNNCTFKGIKLKQTGAQRNAALFRENHGTIKNLEIVSSEIDVSTDILNEASVGMLVGHNYGSVLNCKVIDSKITLRHVRQLKRNIPGFPPTDERISNVVGGIVGVNDGLVDACLSIRNKVYSEVNAQPQTEVAGYLVNQSAGIIGCVESVGVITNCFAFDNSITSSSTIGTDRAYDSILKSYACGAIGYLKGSANRIISSRNMTKNDYTYHWVLMDNNEIVDRQVSVLGKDAKADYFVGFSGANQIYYSFKSSNAPNNFYSYSDFDAFLNECLAFKLADYPWENRDGYLQFPADFTL